MTLRCKFALLTAMVAVSALLTLPALADSQARIVRLSAVDGDVQIDRHTGEGFEKAILNMPVTEGMVLQTDANSRAEVEFEEGTVLRLTPDSAVEFQKLSLRSSGDKVSTIGVQHGTIYFNVVHKGDDQFTVALPEREVPVKKSSHFRVDVGLMEAKLAVFSGELAVKSGDEETKVKKGEELTLELGGGGVQLAKNFSTGEYDAWDKERADYHERYYADSSYKSYPYYGRGDLSYYGSWYDVGGYGSGLWRPYGVGYGWDPFYSGSGYWMYYPGAGYVFVSGYPWGWLPYRYGRWTYVPGWGWGWSPYGYGGWGYWSPYPTFVNPPSGYVVPQPPRPTVPRTPASAVIPTLPHRPTDPGGPARRRVGDEEARVAPQVPAVRVRPAHPPDVRPGSTVDPRRAIIPPTGPRPGMRGAEPIKPGSGSPSRPSPSGPSRQTPSVTPRSAPSAPSAPTPRSAPSPSAPSPRMSEPSFRGSPGPSSSPARTGGESRSSSPSGSKH